MIVVRFLTGWTWEPMVSTQTLVSASTCTASMITTATQSKQPQKQKISGGTIIENDNAGKLKIISGVNYELINAMCNLLRAKVARLTGVMSMFTR